MILLCLSTATPLGLYNILSSGNMLLLIQCISSPVLENILISLCIKSVIIIFPNFSIEKKRLN